MLDFVKKYFVVIVLVLVILAGFKSCADSRKMDRILKECDSIHLDIKSIKDSTYSKHELDIRLKISGLEAEKRMIQATDRKILDVQRQNEIEKEIKELKGEK